MYPSTSSGFPSERVIKILVLGGSQAAKIFAEKLPPIFQKLKNFAISIKVFQQCQKNQNDIKYNLTSTKGPEHDKEFYVTLFIYNKQISRAKGRSLKEAEQNAAKKALKSVS